MNDDFMGYKRTDRLNDQIKEEIADILMTKVKDPRIGFVTLTAVDISPDLRFAKVLVTILETKDPERNLTLEGLQKASSFIRSELGRRLHIRYTPQLSFQVDEKLEEVKRVLNLLEGIREENPDES